MWYEWFISVHLIIDRSWLLRPQLSRCTRGTTVRTTPCTLVSEGAHVFVLYITRTLVSLWPFGPGRRKTLIFHETIYPGPSQQSSFRKQEGNASFLNTPNTMNNGVNLPDRSMSRDPTMFVNSRPATVAIDPVALVVTECITVTSAMRKHARWAHSSVSAILGGGTSRHTSGDRKGSHSRDDSGNLGLTDEDGALSTRWGLRGKKGRSMQDNPLLSAFARLRSDLKSCRGRTNLPYTSSSLFAY